MGGYINFRLALAAKGLRCLDLARTLDVHPSQLSLVLNGHVRPDPEFRRKCAEALGVPEGRLFRTTRRIPTANPVPEVEQMAVVG